jgi:hypothetical protein
MHCKSNFKKGAFFIVVSMLLFNAACTPSSSSALSNPDDNAGYASDASRIERATDDAISIADAAGSVYNGANIRATATTLGTCAYAGTDTTTLYPVKTLTIRFGDKDCVCLDGRPRRGTIIVYYEGEYTDTAQIHTITFDNYYINDNQLTGTIKTTRKDTTITGNWYYKVLVNDSLNMSPDPLNSQYVVWTGTLVHKWVSGYTTPDRNDDAFSISGSATLTRPNGHTFSCNIATPLQVNINCDYVESGIIDVTGYLSPMRVLNYGPTTNCDNQAQLNIANNVYNISLIK